MGMEATKATLPNSLHGAFYRCVIKYAPKKANCSFGAQDASYVRLRTLTLGYNFGSTLNKLLKTTKGRLYFTGTNLFTMTDFLSYSPEQDLRQGVFPETLNLTVGLNLTF